MASTKISSFSRFPFTRNANRLAKTANDKVSESTESGLEQRGESLDVTFPEKTQTSNRRPAKPKINWMKSMAAVVALSVTVSACGLPGGGAPVENQLQEPVRQEQVLEQDSNPTTIVQMEDGNNSEILIPAKSAETELHQEVRALRDELAALRAERQENAEVQEKLEREADYKQLKRNVEVGAAVAEGALCLLLGAIADSPCG